MEKYFTKKMRIATYLVESGYKCLGTLPDFKEPDRVVYLFEKTDDLVDKVDDYYKNLKK